MSESKVFSGYENVGVGSSYTQKSYMDKVFDGYESEKIYILSLLKEHTTTYNIRKFQSELLTLLIDNQTLHTNYELVARRVYCDYHYGNIVKIPWSERISAYEKFSISPSTARLIEKHIDYNRNLNISVFGMITIQKYLVEDIESPQDLFMRVAVAVHSSFDDIIQTYDAMSMLKYIHASPTLFNACMPRQQLASCFLTGISDDSMKSIMDTNSSVGQISAMGGGLGIHIHNVRCNGSTINGSGGKSSGIIPMLRVFNETANYCNQAGKRSGAMAVYLELWHPDIMAFCKAKSHNGNMNQRAVDLFYALWISDLFMRRCEAGEMWTLFCPSVAPGLNKVYGEEHDKLYERYEREGKGHSRVKARDLWRDIMEICVETNPFFLFKDACNRKSNHNHLGTIQCSNLCTEIIQYTDAEEIAVCNLGTVSLPACVKNGVFDFDILDGLVQAMVVNLNRVIDVTHYPDERARLSNMRHRPIGVGIQGLQKLFFILDIAYTSEEAQLLNFHIAEQLYYSALTASIRLAKEYGRYDTYPNSMFSKGILQFDLWPESEYEMRCDWNLLRDNMKLHGTRNSLLTMIPPTATTSHILNNTESIEPVVAHIVRRNTKDGKYMVVTSELVQKLDSIGMWNKRMMKTIITKGGIGSITSIPEHIRNVYKTGFEIDMMLYNKMATDRARFLDQSQSKSFFLKKRDQKTMSKLIRHSWREGHKTGVYYFFSDPAIGGINMSELELTCDDDDGTCCSA